MDDVTKVIADVRIVPVVVLADAAAADPLIAALKDGGLPIAEITFRTDAAEEAIRAAAADADMLVGAGTVLRPEQVDRAVTAGARFVVTPGFSPRVIRACRAHGVPVFPGVATATEIQMALDEGLDVLKFFPAEPAGGVKVLTALSAPYSMVRFIPTGGIGAANAAAYLNNDAVLAVGGSWMVSRDLVAAKNWPEVSRLAAEAVALAR